MRGRHGHRRKSYGYKYGDPVQPSDPAPEERMIKYYCDKCAKEMPTPSADGNACMYFGYNFPEDNVSIHLAYNDMNVPDPRLSRHWCPSCLLRLIEKRLGMNQLSAPSRIISDE